MISLPDHIPDLRRLYGFRAVIVLLLSMIGLRLWYLQLVKNAELAELSQTQSVKVIRRVAPRGVIMDSKGEVLATSRAKFVVSLSPDDAKKHPETLTRLALLLGANEDDLRDKVLPTRIGPTGKKIALRGKPFDPVPLERDVSIKVLSQIEEQRLDLPGVIVSRDPVRYYKDNMTCAHLLGDTGLISEEQMRNPKHVSYHGGDYVGRDGLEAHYEQELRGEDGGENVTVDARGRTLRRVSENQPRAGHGLKLALDLSLQKTAYNLLKEQFDGKNKRNPGSHTGAIVALDPANGEVLALVSMPSFDLNTFGEKYDALNGDKTKPLFNRATSAELPCGSPFKLVTAAAGLESGKAGQYTTYFCPGYKRIGNRIFRCDEVHHNTAFEKAIGASCNVYFYTVGEDVGPDALAEWAKRFGLGRTTGIDLPSGKPGRIPSPAWKRDFASDPANKIWYPGDTANMSIGQGDLMVTPIQLANYTAALANGGTLWRPHLVRAIVDTSGVKPTVVQTILPEARGKLGLKPENLNLIVAGMRKTMQKGGTGFASAILGLDIAGKTGTVEIKKQRNSVFVCFAGLPGAKPSIALAVLVEGGGYGSETAAPLARQLLAQYFHIPITPVETVGTARD